MRTDGTYWSWSSDHRNEVANPKRLNWFGRLGDEPGVSISVEVNTPDAGRHDLVAQFFAKNTENGRTYLFHSGRVGGGANGVKKDDLVAWANLELQPMFTGDESLTEGILVMPISGRGAVRSAILYLQAIIDLKAAVRNRKTGIAKAKEKEQNLHEYFDEFFGREKGEIAAREIDYVSRHGEVAKPLREWPEKKGLKIVQLVVKTAFLDLGAAVPSALFKSTE